VRELQGFPIRTLVVPDAHEAARLVAAEIAALVSERPACALGLATGHTPIATYAELVELHRAGLDFGQVRTFNLDEYEGLGAGQPGSFRSFMQKHLFEPAEFDTELVCFPTARTQDEDPGLAAARFEAEIAGAGGIELQLLGIGRNGHIAFNEPGSARDSRTRLVELAENTRTANSGDFPAGSVVPTRAMTMGISTILEARRLRVLAFGQHKADIVRSAILDPIGPEVPATFLREHSNVVLWLDEAAAAQL
jgi:glucosamine-6-phosphate deaminase